MILKSKGTYLGAATKPNKPSTYQHITSRIQKANAAHNEMTLRGFSQSHLGRKTVSKIINSTITPILTYAMECFPLTHSDYNLINTTLLKLLSKSTNFQSTNCEWDFYENNIEPPSTIIKRNKLKLHIKTHNERKRIN